MIELLFVSVLGISTSGNGHFCLRRARVYFDNKLEKWCFSAVVGLGLLAFLILCFGLAHLLYSGVLYLLLAIWAIFGLREVQRVVVELRASALCLMNAREARPFYLVVASLGLIAFGLCALRALAPPHGATDPLAYQLALPKIYLLKNYLSFEPTITGALYPSFMGLLFLVGISLKSGIVAQLIHLSAALICVLAICSFCRTYFTLSVGVLAGTMFSFVPIVVIFGPQGYVDIGLCLFQFMAFWALINWIHRADRKMIILAGIFAGFALGTKHQGIPTLLFGGLVIICTGVYLKRRIGSIAGDAGIFCVLAIGIVGPWYLRGFVEAGNPIWPMANSLFHGAAQFGLSPEVDYADDGGGDRLILGIVPTWTWVNQYWQSLSPWAWTFSPKGWQKAIGIYFVALVPGIFFLKRARLITALAVFCATYYLVLIRFLHMNPRYAIVLLGFLCILAGIVADHLYKSNKIVSKVFSVAFIVTLIFNVTWSYALARPVFNVAFGRESPENFLRRNETNYDLFKFVNENMTDDSLILLQGIVRGYYCDRQYMWDHPHQGTIRYEDYENAEELYERMRDLEITHVARMIQVPPSRTYLGYPQYFADEFHEDFRNRYLRLMWRDQNYALFSLIDTG